MTVRCRRVSWVVGRKKSAGHRPIAPIDPPVTVRFPRFPCDFRQKARLSYNRRKCDWGIIYRPQLYGHRPSTGECLADISDIVRSPDGHRKMTDQRPFSVPGCIKGARPASGVFPVLEVRQSCTRILHFCEFFWIFLQALSCIGHRSRPDTYRAPT